MRKKICECFVAHSWFLWSIFRYGIVINRPSIFGSKLLIFATENKQSESGTIKVPPNDVESRDKSIGGISVWVPQIFLKLSMKTTQN